MLPRMTIDDVIDLQGDCLNTALMSASEHGRWDIVHYLLTERRAEIDVNAADDAGITSFLFASQNGHDSVVSILLQLCSDIDVNGVDHNKKTALMYACEGGFTRIVEILTAIKQINVLACDRHKKTALTYACDNGHMEIAEHIMSFFDTTTRQRDMLYGCYNGNFKIVEFLVSRGVKTSWRRCSKVFALHLACQSGNSKIVEFLLNSGYPFSKKYAGKSPLLVACSNGDEDTVKVLLVHGAKIDDCDGFKKTALMYACGEGHKAVAEILLRAGANVNARDRRGFSALIYAFENCQLNVVSLLLRRRDINVCRISKSAYSPLAYASRLGHVSLVHRLLDRGADVNETGMGQFNTSPLIQACQNGGEAIVKLLLQQNIDLNKEDVHAHHALYYAHSNSFNKIIHLLLRRPGLKLQKDFEIGLLEHACKLKDEEMVKLLRHVWGSVDSEGSTLLSSACREPSKTVVDMLLKFVNIDIINTRDTKGKTALIYALEGNHSDIALSLLQKGIEVNSLDSYDMTPLLYSCWGSEIKLFRYVVENKDKFGLRDSIAIGPMTFMREQGPSAKRIVRKLVEYGADMEAMNKEGKTALMLACEKGFEDGVDVLVRKGALVNSRDKSGKTALMYAFTHCFDNSKIIKQLYQARASIDAKDETGKTVLMYGIESKKQFMSVRLLMRAGINLNSRAKDGKTAMMLACEMGCKTVVDWLSQARADLNVQDNLGQTALMLACIKGHFDIVNQLIRYGANFHVCDSNGKTAVILARESGFGRIHNYLLKVAG